MPVYIHLANLLVPKNTIEINYEGGIKQFKIDFNAGAEYFQEDDELFCVAGMNEDEFNTELLQQRGLRFNSQLQQSTDYVILTRYGGTEWPVNWLEDNEVYAWHIACAPSSKQKAKAYEEMLMSEIEDAFNRGENPFAVIKL